MTERARSARYSMNGIHDRHTQLTTFNEFPVPEDQPADVATGLVSLGYIRAAIKQSLLFVCVLVIAGMLIGLGVFVKKPPSYKAQTSVLITYALGDNPSMAIFDNQAIAQSHTVAKLAMDKLGITNESLGSFAASYTVAVITERVMQITASAPTPSGAVSRASAVATEFLQFLALGEETAQNVTVDTMQLELSQDMKNVASLDSQISRVMAEPQTQANQIELARLQDQETQAARLVSSLQESIVQTASDSGTISAVKGSVILDPAAVVPYPKTKYLLSYGGYGIVGGLAIGLGIVIIRALGSDKLRRRDDIARALGAQVGLSVGVIRLNRKLLPSRRGLEAVDDPEIRRIAAYLRTVVSAKDGHLALAVVPANSAGVAALSLVALAMSYAQDGCKVMLADLASGMPVAALLAQKTPGISTVQVRQASLALVVPFPEDLDPCAPGNHGSASARLSTLSDKMGDAYGSVDVLLTLGTLDPARGGDYLATWADNAAAIVTAGRSTWTQLQATGELVRIAGMSLVPAVLVDADKSDESLGLRRSGPDAPFGFSGLS
jgi:capsular polysaccharide biosynthesis protein